MKILVTAASRHGSTTQIGEWVAAVLRSHGHDADVLAPGRVTSLSGYGAVVLGSAVYMGGWLKEAKSFANRFRGDLADRRVWLFSSGPVGDPLVPADQLVKLGDLLTRSGAVAHRMFSGSLDATALSIRERIAVRAIGVSAGDYRDWDAIAEWASAIAEALDRDPASTR
jgi:menaquinone-dependent protoporphyrinogen oxidase